MLQKNKHVHYLKRGQIIEDGGELIIKLHRWKKRNGRIGRVHYRFQISLLIP